MEENDIIDRTSLLKNEIHNKSKVFETTSDKTFIIKQENEELKVDEKDYMHFYDLPNMENVNKTVRCRLTFVCIVCFLLMIAECLGGYFAHSLAIMTDAAHLFSDISGFIISIFSLWLARKPSTNKLSYGYHRAEVIGALGSVILIWGLTIWLVYEAIQRVIYQDFEIQGEIMLITACFGLFCNLIMGKILHSGAHVGHSHGGHSHSHSHGHSHNHKGHLHNDNLHKNLHNDQLTCNEIDNNNNNKNEQKKHIHNNCKHGHNENKLENIDNEKYDIESEQGGKKIYDEKLKKEIFLSNVSKDKNSKGKNLIFFLNF